MLFASRRLNGLEKAVERLENRLEHLAQTWEQQKIGLLDLQETASHMLSRLAMRHKRELKKACEDRPADSAAPEPQQDEITARILERRRKGHVSGRQVQG